MSGPSPDSTGVFGIAVLVAVFSAAGGYASAQAFVDGFGPALGITAALSAARRGDGPLSSQQVNPSYNRGGDR